jgi:hypothetical protein
MSRYGRRSELGTAAEGSSLVFLDFGACHTSRQGVPGAFRAVWTLAPLQVRRGPIILANI